VIYAPNAVFQLQGTQDLYGSVLAKTVENFVMPAFTTTAALARFLGPAIRWRARLPGNGSDQEAVI